MNAVAGCLVLAAMLALSSLARAQDAAAEVTALRGRATAISDSGVTRRLARGSDLFQGDRIDTGRNSAISVRFTDGSRFQLGEQASMSVDDYAYAESGNDVSFTTSIFKGVFRFVSGLIAKRRSRSMGVRTPVVTIGIRGTSVGGEVDASSARIILLEPEEAGPTAIEVSNAFGSVTIDEPGYGTEVPDANSPPSPARRMEMRTVQNLMRSMQSIGRMPVAPRIR